MPTLFSALRTHVTKRRTPVQTFNPRPGSIEEMVTAPAIAAGKKPKEEEIYRLSLADRFKGKIHRPSEPPSVIVVGAGFAGLSAAYELQSVGYNVTVVEGRSRHGGRVKTLHKFIPGLVVEGGAELIGSNHHAWLSYKHTFGLHFSDVIAPPKPPVVLDGRRLSDAEAAVLGRELIAATDVLNRAAKNVDPNEPWKSPGAKDLDKLSLWDAVKKMRKTSDLCKLALLEQLVTDNGVSAEKQSYLGVLAMIQGGGGSKYWDDTEVFRCKEGNQSLAKQLASALPKGSVRYNWCAKKIRFVKGGVRVWPEKGEPITASDVILAVPSSVLSGINVKPRITKNYIGQFGKNVKYLMNVGKNSWSPVPPALSSDGPVDLTWQGTDYQPGPRAALVAFSGAKDAETVRKWKGRKHKYLKELNCVYPSIKDGIGNCKFMDWPGNKWTRGSYSFPAPREVMRTGPLLHEPFHERIHFAGEHTCYAFVGYMEGALQSGLRIAERLARRDKIIP